MKGASCKEQAIKKQEIRIETNPKMGKSADAERGRRGGQNTSWTWGVGWELDHHWMRSGGRVGEEKTKTIGLEFRTSLSIIFPIKLALLGISIFRRTHLILMMFDDVWVFRPTVSLDMPLGLHHGLALLRPSLWDFPIGVRYFPNAGTLVIIGHQNGAPLK